MKVDWGKLTTTASLFQISQPSVITNVASNTQVLAGQQVNQGLELNFFGEAAPGFRVLGGAMFLNAVLTQTQGGLTNGWIAPFSPGAQFNLGAEWDLPFAPGLTVNGRVTYTGSQFIDTTFPRRSLPEWARVDAGLRGRMPQDALEVEGQQDEHAADRGEVHGRLAGALEHRHVGVVRQELVDGVEERARLRPGH